MFLNFIVISVHDFYSYSSFLILIYQFIDRYFVFIVVCVIFVSCVPIFLAQFSMLM